MNKINHTNSEIKRAGFIGGSFNPVHLRHLEVARAFRNGLNLDLCCFVPANLSPGKSEADYAPAEDRLNMLQLAVEGEENLLVSDFELRRGGVSYTYFTVEHFKTEYPNAELFMLVGSDQAAKFDLWRNYRKIARSLTVCVVRRDHDEALAKRIAQIFEIAGGNYLYLDIPQVKASSTEIRDRIRSGIDCVGLAPQKVLDYIRAKRLYLQK